MHTGVWAGTMCLTETQAGSDVGAATTKATKCDDGRYSIEGTKIFISCGQHNLAGNIVHMVLARTPGNQRYKFRTHVDYRIIADILHPTMRSVTF